MNTKITIPKNWQQAKLKDVCNILIGGTPARKEESYWDTKKEGNNVWVSIRDLSNCGKYILDSNEYITDEGISKSNVKRIPKGTVLMSFKLSIGKRAITKKELYTNEAIASFLLKDTNILDYNFLYYILPTLMYDTDTAVKGITLNKQKLNNTDIYFPPLPVQKKIADILSTVDEDIEKTDKIIQKSEELKKGLMKELFSGNWKIVKMQDICDVRQGLQMAIKDRFKEPGKNRHVYITIKYLKNMVDTDYIENPSKRVICKKEDVLMTRTGNTGIVITEVEGVFHNNFFLVDFDRNLVEKKYLVYYLKSKKVQDLILDRAGTTTIPDLNHGDFYSIPFVMPPIDKQREIADILSAIDKKIEINKQIKNKLTELKKGLMQDLLSGYVRVN